MTLGLHTDSPPFAQASNPDQAKIAQLALMRQQIAKKYHDKGVRLGVNNDLIIDFDTDNLGVIARIAACIEKCSEVRANTYFREKPDPTDKSGKDAYQLHPFDDVVYCDVRAVYELARKVYKAGKADEKIQHPVIIATPPKAALDPQKSGDILYTNSKPITTDNKHGGKTTINIQLQTKSEVTLISRSTAGVLAIGAPRILRHGKDGNNRSVDLAVNLGDNKAPHVAWTPDIYREQVAYSGIDIKWQDHEP